MTASTDNALELVIYAQKLTPGGPLSYTGELRWLADGQRRWHSATENDLALVRRRAHEFVRHAVLGRELEHDAVIVSETVHPYLDAPPETWNESGLDEMAQVRGRALWVADGTLGHYAIIWDLPVLEALRDYANGYDAGDDTEITVEWRLFADGEETESGRWTFEAK